MKKITRFVFVLVLTLSTMVTANAQDRDEMNGVTVTGTVSADDSNTNHIEVILRNNNEVTVRNIRYEVSYSCGGKTTTVTKSFDFMPARYSATLSVDYCMRMIGDGRPETTIQWVRMISVN
jgi:hypothetical protein